MKITGTFLDEITHDIPTSNWGAREWAADFDAMQAVGIDTVILIRSGYRDRLTLPSAVLANATPFPLQLLARYRDEGAEPLVAELDPELGIPLHALPLMDPEALVARHHPDLLNQGVREVIRGL